LRLGIGPVPPGADPADFVLGPFAPEELEAVGAMAGRAAGCVEAILRHGLDRAMGEFNRPYGVSQGDEKGPGKRVDPAGNV
jgi:PTH1 family peptidyl-tRNA hydrolase